MQWRIISQALPNSPHNLARNLFHDLRNIDGARTLLNIWQVLGLLLLCFAEYA
jgi:hypothetical protein